MFFPNHHFRIFGAFGFHCENRNSEVTLAPTQEGPQGVSAILSWLGHIWLGYSILYSLHRYKVFFNKYFVAWVICLSLPMPLSHLLSTKS